MALSALYLQFALCGTVIFVLGAGCRENGDAAVPVSPSPAAVAYSSSTPAQTEITTAEQVQRLEEVSRSLQDETAKSYEDRGARYLLLAETGIQAAYRLSILDLSRAIEIDPKSDAYRWRAVAYADSNNTEKALEDFATAIGRHPEDPALYLRKGRLLADMGRDADAIRAFDKAYGHGAVEALLHRGRMRLRRGETEEAKNDFEKVIGESKELGLRELANSELVALTKGDRNLSTPRADGEPFSRE